jgi:tetratricopeptide (TPR) repeat protein
VLARAYELSNVLNAAVVRGDFDEAAPFVRDYGAKASIAAEKAYRLDPNNSDAVYGYAQAMEGRLDVSRMTLLERSLALDPDNPEPLQSYSYALAALGFTKQALNVRDHLVAVEPFVPVYRGGLVRLLFADGQLDEAIKIGTSPLTNGTRLPLAQAYAAQGRFKEAADALAPMKGPDVKSQQVIARVVQILRDAPAPLPLNGRSELGVLDWVYVYRGAPERLAEAYENLARAGIPIGLLNGLQFAPAYAAMRKTPAFKQYMRDSGAVEYWRAKGWPQWCHPTTNDDFICN